MTLHCFDSEVAKVVGVNAAVIYHNICFWIEKNTNNRRNFRDGKVWTYSSMNQFQEQLPYLTFAKIRLALQKLRDEEFLVVGNYNKDARDKTFWYAKPDTSDLSETTNLCARNDKPLPDSNTDINKLNKKPNSDTIESDRPISQNTKTVDEWFNEFYKTYPLKKGKAPARKAFEKAIKRETPEKIIAAAAKYAVWLADATGRNDFRPNPKFPKGWLNDDRWEDFSEENAGLDPLRERYRAIAEGWS